MHHGFSAVLIGVLSLPAVVAAQDNATSEVVTVSATASRSVRPDIAEILFTINVTSGTADSATSEVAEAARGVVRVLSEFSSEPPVMFTDAFSVQAGRTDQRTALPFEHVAKNDFRVIVTGVESVSDVIERAVRIANVQVRGVRFSASNLGSARDEALASAVASARKRAELIAELADLRLGRVVHLIVHPDRDEPWSGATQFVANSSGPPIRPQDLVVTAHITIQYAVLP
ncbi:MAG: SIMPL domain-containing protein [Gemmatimonadota bacterium]